MFKFDPPSNTVIQPPIQLSPVNINKLTPIPLMIEEMVYWINARESARIHKESGGKYPHHSDPIIANNRFCNVRRADDKVTRWVANWLHYAKANIVLAATIARFINNIPCLENLPYPEIYNDEYKSTLRAYLMDRKEKGLKVWGSAYLISTCGQPIEKADYLLQVLDRVNDYFGDHNYEFSTLAKLHKDLMSINGLGSFLAAQIVADLKYVDGFPLEDAPDWNSWSSHGPGSLNGLTDFFGVAITPKTYQQALSISWDSVRPLLPENLQNLSSQDFQNVHCEFSKFVRIKYKNGRAKCSYDGSPR